MLIERKVAAAAATLDFTKGIDSRFDEYLFKISNLSGAGDFPALQVSEDGGGTWKAGAADYNFGIGQATTAAAFGGTGGGAGSTQMFIAANGGPYALTLNFSQPGSAGVTKLFGWHGGSIAGGLFGGGIYQGTTNAINGIRFKLNTGAANLGGTFALYGYRKA